MTTKSSSNRMSVDVSDLVDQLRPYTPQSSRKTLHDAPLNSFDTNTSSRVFSSPLPPSNHRGKPTAEEAAKVLLADDPFLKLRTPRIEHSMDSQSTQDDSQPQPHLINIKVPPTPIENANEDGRVSASFRIRAPEAALAFSPVLPRPPDEALPPTEPLLSTSSSPSSYALTRSHRDPPTPVSAAKPPRPPVPRLESLHSSSEQQPHGCHSPTPSTPFGGLIPLSYSAVKTPGAAPLDYLGETPASARQNNETSSMIAFFRSRSAHVTSPIFSAKKKVDCEDLGSPEVRVNPLADSAESIQAIPDGVLPEIVVRMDFSLGYGFDRAEDVDLSSRANRVPVLYAVVVRTTDLDGDIRPVFARLERDSDSPHTMLVDVVENGVNFVPVESSQDSSNESSDSSVHEAVLTFWAAPDSFIQFGSATLLLTVVDRDEMSHETKVELHVVGTEPILAIETRENHPEPERKETTVTFRNSRSSGEESITIRNQTFGCAPLLINALITDSASGAFTIRDREGQVRDCIPMLIPGGRSYSFTACFDILPNVTLRGRYYGCVLLKLATLMPSKGRHTSSDIDLHQFYDHVLNLEAHIAGIAPPSRLSTLEDPSSTNIEEMLYEHRYGNDHDADLRQQRYPYSSSQYSRSVDGKFQEHGRHETGNSEIGITGADRVLKRLSLVVSPEAREPLPEGFETKPYMVCEYNLGDAPRWITPGEELVDTGLNQEDLQSVDTEMKQPLDDPEEESKRIDDDYRGSPTDARNLRYSHGSYEEWKKSLEDVETAPGVNDKHEQDADVCPNFESSRAEDFPNGRRKESAQDGNIGSFSDKMNELASNDEFMARRSAENIDSCQESVKANSISDSTESEVEESDLLGLSHHSNRAESQKADEEEFSSGQLCSSNSLLVGAQKINEKNVPVANPLDTSSKLSVTILPETKPSQTITPPQRPFLDEPGSLKKAPANHKKPPLPTRIPGKTNMGGWVIGRQGGGAVGQDIISRLKEGTQHVDGLEDGVQNKSRRNLKDIISSLGGAVDDLKPEHGFLQQYTKFDSNFNMSEDLSAQGSRNVSISSAGSLATLNAPQRPGLRNLTSKWGVNRGNDAAAYKPKLRIPRKLLEKGLSITADSGTTRLTVCNGSLTTIGVDISAKQGLRRKAQILIEPPFLALRPEQKAVIRLTRLASEESKASIVLACSNLNGSKLLSCTYRLPIVIEAAKNRVPIVQGFAVDRPTLTFYNPKSTARHCRVRVLNGTKRKVTYKVWIGKNKDSSHHESVFSILSHHEGTVEPHKCFSVIVVFDALGRTKHFHEELCIRVGRKTDYIPMFGYGGASNIKFSRSERGHLRVHNSGSRHGFLVLSGPEVESPENTMTRAVLGPNEARDFVAPYGSGTIIFTGDEIARSRLCQSQELLEIEHGERVDESSLFLGHFDGQEQATKEEGLFWGQENKHSLHYAGRLMDSNTQRFMFDANSGDIVPYVERNQEADVSWHASLNGSRFIHIENYDSKHELTFTAVGTEPNAGSIPPLGDAIVAAFADTVRIYARGQCLQLES